MYNVFQIYNIYKKKHKQFFISTQKCHGLCAMIKTFSVVWGGRSIPQSSSENNKNRLFYQSRK